MRGSELLDTIAAIATPPGPGGISVIRMSGSRSVLVAGKVFASSSPDPSPFVPSTVRHGYIKDPGSGRPIDECLLLFMKSPASYTGEDVVEIQCHGGTMPAYRVLTVLLGQGVRMAEPGEFTRRAFMNGKKDLLQAEAVESLIGSRTEFQQETALAQLRGELGSRLAESALCLRESCLELEAKINFPEETGSGGAVVLDAELHRLDSLLQELQRSFVESRPFVEGVRAAIIGKPNVGKSSLLNSMLEYERAIVSAYPGTTRDFIEETVVMEGMPIRLLDTAGLRSSTDPLELEGMKKTAGLLPSASVLFALFDVSRPLDSDDRRIIDLAESRSDAMVFALLNKIDLEAAAAIVDLPERFTVCRLSLATGEGLPEFRNAFRRRITEVYGAGQAREIYLTNPRQYAIVTSMRDAVKEYREGQPQEDRLLFTVTELLAQFDRLTGRSVSEDEINEIFSRFCIGK